MHILIVAEKPAIIRAIAPHARRHWPDAHLAFINAVPYGNFKFAYPRGQKWADFPVVSEPVHKLADWADWLCPPVVFGTNETLTLVPTTASSELLAQADLIVNACDPDHTGAVSFDILLSQVFGDDRAKDCPTLNLWALDEKSIQKSFDELRPFGEVFAHQVAYGHAKRYFEWNWNVNALAILGETARRVGVLADTLPVSKYALQLLYALQGRESLSEGKVIDLMNKWPGTGRYSYSSGQWRPRLGSCASSSAIIKNLQMAGLLATDHKHIQLTALGEAFLAALHPDCKDLDLPFRLDAWCGQGSAAKPAMDRYLRTFFGKQKRFLEGVSPC